MVTTIMMTSMTIIIMTSMTTTSMISLTSTSDCHDDDDDFDDIFDDKTAGQVTDLQAVQIAAIPLFSTPSA
jgi:hypothetical protein